MKKQRKKTRHAGSYRAGSLKGWRTRARMQRAREPEYEVDESGKLTKFSFGDLVLEVAPRKPDRTIDLIPKVQWP